MLPINLTAKGLLSLPFLKPSKIVCKPTQGLEVAPVTFSETVFLVFCVM